MAVHIRLARHGSKKTPFYRIVVTDHRNPRDGRFIETVGTFDPSKEQLTLTLKEDRLDYWTKQGAQSSATVARLLSKHRAAKASADS